MRPNPSPFAIGVLLLVLGAVSVQAGAALGASVIPATGVAGIVVVRYLVQAAVHVPLAWKGLASARLPDWRWGMLVAVPLIVMNTAIYLAFEQMGVGLSVTIELLGPILLAVVTARSWPGWVGACLAAIGMVLVTGPTGSATPLGVFWATLAAASWAAYLVAARVAGARLSGLTPTAMASLLGLVVLLPTVAYLGVPGELSWPVLLTGLAAGVASSAVPYAFDIVALRRVPMNVASTMMSVNPVMAVLFGWLILDERLGLAELAGLGVICVANVLVVRAASRQKAARY
ncbi:DMT family transporter [Tessaracoccus sp. OH4464_COT-324]|uniref:EamA family transporter n=1 Tax=Tessaracoccus sp. OH4464_COT-324 TaxID=2491059 RepID=UPI000F64236C|nr:EamA family transporter [Tessaracoccus sp. OH4464_COT-324]RRD46193.1 EamA family transporter [Tessaracoccus sp. OH4464_COT-324]